MREEDSYVFCNFIRFLENKYTAFIKNHKNVYVKIHKCHTLVPINKNCNVYIFILVHRYIGGLVAC